MERPIAGLDPLFWFHHCFVDYAFWSWQKKQKLTATGSLTVDMGYPGTNSSDASPAAYQSPNTFLDMDTPLYPFKKQDKSWYTSNDVTDIVEQLGYTYGPGSLDPLTEPRLKAPKLIVPRQIKRISGINRLDHKGSFVVRTQAIAHDGKAYEIGREEILSRWNVSGCKNCQTHLGVTSFVPIHEGLADLLRGSGRNEDVKYVVKLQTRDGVKRVNAIIDDL